MNPIPLVLFAFGTAVGYLCGGPPGAVVGFAVTSGIVLVVSVLN